MSVRSLGVGGSLDPTNLPNIGKPFGWNAIFERNNLASEHPEILARLMDQHYNWTLTHEREPMWMDAPFWGASVRAIHRKEFQLTQPTE